MSDSVQFTDSNSRIGRCLYIVIRVKVWVSIADIPSIVSNDFRNEASGAKVVAPQASKCSAERETITCKEETEIKSKEFPGYMNISRMISYFKVQASTANNALY